MPNPTTKAPSPVFGQSWAAALILEHAERTALPMPHTVSYSDASPDVQLMFRTLADLAEWALWIEAQVHEHRASDGGVHHVATGHALDQPVRLVRVENNGADR